MEGSRAEELTDRYLESLGPAGSGRKRPSWIFVCRPLTDLCISVIPAQRFGFHGGAI